MCFINRSFFGVFFLFDFVGDLFLYLFRLFGDSFFDLFDLFGYGFFDLACFFSRGFDLLFYRRFYSLGLCLDSISRLFRLLLCLNAEICVCFRVIGGEYRGSCFLFGRRFLCGLFLRLDESADGKADLAVVVVDADDLRVDLVAYVENFRGRRDLVIGDLADVDKSVSSGNHFRESAELHQRYDLDLRNVAERILVSKDVPGIGFLCLVSERNSLLLLVDAFTNTLMTSPTETTSEG